MKRTRLIDADALLDKLGIRGVPIVLTHVIDTFPTVDAVEVVRCKDCWYSSVIPEEMQNVGEWHCEYWCAEMHEDDFCSCGKRREDGKRDNS